MKDFTSGIAKNWLNDWQRSFWVLNFSNNDLSKAKTPTPNYHDIYIYIFFFLAFVPTTWVGETI